MEKRDTQMREELSILLSHVRSSCENELKGKLLSLSVICVLAGTCCVLTGTKCLCTCRHLLPDSGERENTFSMICLRDTCTHIYLLSQRKFDTISFSYPF